MRSLCGMMLHRAAVTRATMRTGYVPFYAGRLTHQFRGQWSLTLGRLLGMLGKGFIHSFIHSRDQIMFTKHEHTRLRQYIED